MKAILKILIFGMVACISSPSAMDFTVGYDPYLPVEFLEVTPEMLKKAKQYSDEDAVILWDHVTEKYKAALIKCRHKAIKINNEKGLKHAELIFESLSGKTINIMARTISPKGKSILLKKSDITWDEKKIWSIKNLRFKFPLAEPGCIVEYIVTEVVTNGIGELRNQFSLYSSLPVLDKSITIVVPEEWTTICREYNGADKFKTNAEDKKIRLYESAGLDVNNAFCWRFSSSGSILDEPLIPPIRHIFPSVFYFTRWPQQQSASFVKKDWKKVRKTFKWADYYWLDKNSDKEKALSIIADKNDPVEQIKALYGFACSYPEGSAENHESDDFHGGARTDCLGSAGILHALLNASGFDASVVAIKSLYEGVLDKEVPGDFQFDEFAVATVNPGTAEIIWLQPQKKGLGFGELAWYCCDVWGLALSPSEDMQSKFLDKDGFIKTPEVSEFENSVSVEVKLDILPDNSVSYEAKEIHRGQSCYLNWQLLNPEAELKDRKENMENKFRDIPGMELESWDVQLDEVNGELRLKYKVLCKDCVDKGADDISIVLNPLRIESFPFEEKDREMPILFRAPVNTKQRIVMEIPEGYEADVLDRSENEYHIGGFFSGSDLRIEDNKIILDNAVKIDELYINQTEYLKIIGIIDYAEKYFYPVIGMKKK